MIVLNLYGGGFLSSILKIKNLQSSFTDSENKIAKYILEHGIEVCNLTAEELANTTNTSPASIIRFSKKVGYSGFQELKIAIAKDTEKDNFNENKIYEAITCKDSTTEIIEKIALENIKAIKDTIKLLDKDSIDKATNVMINADKINLFGVGSSSLVAADLQYKLVRINMPAVLHEDYHLQLVSASNMNEKSVAIAISHSGKTKETYKALEIAKKAGAKTISITKFGNNPISDMADINIYTSEIETKLRMGAIASRIAQLTVIDILFVNIIKKNYDVIPPYILKTGHIIGDLKMKD